MRIDAARVYSRAQKSVVIVADERNATTDYCSGFVAFKSVPEQHTGVRATFVIASSEFVTGREAHISVCFFDRVKLRATVAFEESRFCVLRTTTVHMGCEEINFVEDASCLTPSCAFMVAPSSQSVNHREDSYIVVESLESYLVDHEVLLAASKDYFVLACQYDEKTWSVLGRMQFEEESAEDESKDELKLKTSKLEKTGLDRLTCSPVFNMSGKALGVIVADCRTLKGDKIKVAMKAIAFKKMMGFSKSPPAPRMKVSAQSRKDVPSPATGVKRKRGGH